MSRCDGHEPGVPGCPNPAETPDPLQAKLDRYRDLVALALEGMGDVWAGDAGPKFWRALDALEKEQPVPGADRND